MIELGMFCTVGRATIWEAKRGVLPPACNRFQQWNLKTGVTLPWNVSHIFKNMCRNLVFQTQVEAPEICPIFPILTRRFIICPLCSRKLNISSDYFACFSSESAKKPRVWHLKEQNSCYLSKAQKLIWGVLFGIKKHFISLLQGLCNTLP